MTCTDEHILKAVVEMDRQNPNMRNTSFLKRVKGLLPMIAVFYITFVDIVLNTPYNKQGVLLKCGGILALEAVG
jgi:hypothetical protein